jgi:hypothetical protein
MYMQTIEEKQQTKKSEYDVRYVIIQIVRLKLYKQTYIDIHVATYQQTTLIVDIQS